MTTPRPCITCERSEPEELSRSLARFRREHQGRATAFLIMRFGRTEVHRRIVETLRAVLDQHGIAAVRADEREYHEDLFYNILTYAHGSSFGIAIFERLETDDFNPNISLEVGYMLGIKKPVCLLKDRTLRGLHTDLVGRLYREFDPQSPENSIPEVLEAWLRDKSEEIKAQNLTGVAAAESSQDIHTNAVGSSENASTLTCADPGCQDTEKGNAQQDVPNSQPPDSEQPTTISVPEDRKEVLRRLLESVTRSDLRDATEKLLLEMGTALLEEKKHAAMLIAEVKKSEHQLNAALSLASEWSKKADLARRAGVDDLAADAQSLHNEHQRKADKIRELHAENNSYVDKAKIRLRSLNSHYEEVKEITVKLRRAALRRETLPSASVVSDLSSSVQRFVDYL